MVDAEHCGDIRGQRRRSVEACAVAVVEAGCRWPTATNDPGQRCARLGCARWRAMRSLFGGLDTSPSLLLGGEVTLDGARCGGLAFGAERFAIGAHPVHR